MTVLLADRPVTGVAGGACVDTALAAELRMLCRGLAHSSLPYLATVRTVVLLSESEAHEWALRRVCAQVAREFGLGAAVRRAGYAWEVCFSRPVADELVVLKAVRAPGIRHVPLLARLAWVRDVLRHPFPPERPARYAAGGDQHWVEQFRRRCRSASDEEAVHGGHTMNLEYVVMGTISLLVLIYLLVALLRPELF